LNFDQKTFPGELVGTPQNISWRNPEIRGELPGEEFLGEAKKFRLT